MKNIIFQIGLVFEQAFSGLFTGLMCYITVSILFIFILSVIINLKDFRNYWKSSYSIIFIQPLFIILTNLVAVAWWNHSYYPHKIPTPVIAQILLLICIIVPIIIAVYCAVIVRSLRFFSISFSMLNALLQSQVVFIATMALSGAWL